MTGGGQNFEENLWFQSEKCVLWFSLRLFCFFGFIHQTNKLWCVCAFALVCAVTIPKKKHKVRCIWFSLTVFSKNNKQLVCVFFPYFSFRNARLHRPKQNKKDLVMFCFLMNEAKKTNTTQLKQQFRLKPKMFVRVAFCCFLVLVLAV